MYGLQPWAAMLLAWIGNCGFWLFCFNRVNAVGIPRFAAKLLEKVCIALCFIIPTVILWFNWPTVSAWLHSNDWLPTAPSNWLVIWLVWSYASIIVLGPLWLESRIWLIPPRHLVATQTNRHRVHREIAGGSALNIATKCLSMVPLNEWADLSVTCKTLQLPRSIPAADGLKVGHLSDLHFTGQYRAEHYEFVIAKMQELAPEIIVISGDIIDYADYLPMIPAVLGQISAPMGVYFVLGNHDRRLRDISPLLEQLTRLGFHDLGIEDRLVHRGSLSVLLTGNEQPWFERHYKRAERPSSSTLLNSQTLRLGVAHTPDRILWARQNQIDLLLAGHTHGGQARIPGIGPLVAPSLYGSKFASGVFWLPPTLMHVSRGVAGTHPLRWRCPPEISLLTLISSSN